MVDDFNEVKVCRGGHLRCADSSVGNLCNLNTVIKASQNAANKKGCRAQERRARSAEGWASANMYVKKNGKRATANEEIVSIEISHRSSGHQSLFHSVVDDFGKEHDNKKCCQEGKCFAILHHDIRSRKCILGKPF